MERISEINDKLRKAMQDVMREYDVKWVDVSREYNNWKGEYLEDPLSRVSKIIADKSIKE